MAAADPSLKIIDLHKAFPASVDGGALDVLRGINETVQPGESVAIVGPSGSGKSTLLNIIGTLDQPSSGQVLLGDQDLTTLSEDDMATFRNRRLGFVFQSHYLLPQCNVLENVLVPTLAGNGEQHSGSKTGRAKDLLVRVGLEARMQHVPGQLSGGERQRVAVVRALINQPSLLLADEPTGALDRRSAETLGDLLAELNEQEKVTLIVVTHSLELAAKLGRTLELLDGQLVTRPS